MKLSLPSSAKGFISGRPTNRFFYYSTPNKMNLRYTALAACWASSAAWLQTPVRKNSRHNDVYNRIMESGRVGGSVIRLMATVAPENEGVITALTPSGQPIGEGSVVACLPGGLIAVKVDDSIDVSVAENPEVVDTTNELPKEQKPQKSQSGGDLIGRQVVFETGKVGVVVNHRPPLVFVYTDTDSIAVEDGKATVLDSLASIDVSDGVRSTDCFGRALNGSASGDDSLKRAIFSPIPKVKDIALINKPLLTGITMFDALAPIGKGQNMLMVGHDIHDMRQYVCDMLSVQSKDTKCVYAATSDQEEIKNMLSEANVLDDIVLVSSSSNGDDARKVASAAEATVTAATACSIAEAFATEKGLDTFVVIDSLDQHKELWDATTRVLVDVFGVEAVVQGDRDGGASSEMRAFFSSLIQRSAQYKVKYGGGSVTVLLMHTIPKLSDGEDSVFQREDFEGSPEKVKERIDMLVQRKIPLTAENLRKIQIPIPSDLEGGRRFALQHVDDLISMTDGQIWFDEELERNGRNPAMDYQRSVTRIGIGADTESRADAPAIRHVVEGLRLDLSQALAMDGADVETNASKKQMRAANAWLLAMHQPSASGARKLSESCALLLAAAKGYFDGTIDAGILAGTPEAADLVKQLMEHVNSSAPAAMDEVDSSLDLSDDTKKVVEEAIKSYFDSK